MNFPNISVALRLRRVTQYELASRMGISESRLSRCLAGRYLFTENEIARIVEMLGFEQSWLFEQPAPRRIEVNSENETLSTQR